MDIAELSDLAGQVAYELTSLRGEVWTVATTTDDTWPSAELSGEDGARLKLIFGWYAPGKVTVEGMFPPATGSRADYRANVDPARGPEVLARAADRRVLQAGYLDVLPSAIAQRAEMDRREAARAELLGRVAALFGIDPADPGDGRKVFLGQFLAGSGYVETYYADPDSLTFSLSGIPAATALRMLAVLAEDTSGRNISAAS
jgi:hypothetical protein